MGYKGSRDCFKIRMRGVLKLREKDSGEISKRVEDNLLTLVPK